MLMLLQMCFPSQTLILFPIEKDRTDHGGGILAYLNRLFAFAKTKTQISFAVTAKLISVFVFATRILQSLYFLNPKFQASSHLLWLYSPVCVGPGRKSRRPVFSERGSSSIMFFLILFVHVSHLKLLWSGRTMYDSKIRKASRKRDSLKQ